MLTFTPRDHRELADLASKSAVVNFDQWACAVNLAGRAIAHVENDWQFAELSIGDDAGEIRYGDDLPLSAGHEADSIAYGIAAESVVCATPGGDLILACQDDLSHAAELLGTKLAFESPSFRSAYESGRAFADKFLDSIRLLALELIARGSLSIDECREIHSRGIALP
jgi:hypothetical protein